MTAAPIRTTGWQSRLTAYLSEATGRAFAPGRHDCTLFSAGAVAAMTGVDLARGWRGRYSTLRGGQRILRRAGHADHVALAAAHLPEIPVALAGPGDLAVVPTGDGPALGVVQGERIYLVGPEGLLMPPLTAASRAFRVPHVAADGEAA